MIQRVGRWLGVLLLVSGLVGAVMPANALAATSHYYTLQVLPMPSGTDGWQMGGSIVDDAEDVVSAATEPGNFQHVLIWKSGSSSAIQPASYAELVNVTHGGTVLYWNLSDGQLHQYVISTSTDSLATNVLLGAAAMNASQVMVGTYLPSNSQIPAAGKAPLGSTNVNQITDLGFGIDSGANDINDSGDVVGYGSCSTATQCAYYYDHSTHTATSLGPDGSDQTATMQAIAINASGEAAGNSWFNYGYNRPPFKYTKAGGVEFLGMGTSPTGIANDINSAGDIVGQVTGLGAVLWPSDSTDPIELSKQIVLSNLTGWSLDYGESINDDGVITALGSLSGQSTTFVLAPALDGTAPRSTGTIVDGSDTLATPNGAGWYNDSTLKLRIQVQDNEDGFGVKNLTLTVNSSTSTLATGNNGQPFDAVTFSEGTNSVSYYGTDLAGNSETAHNLTVKYDKTAPTFDCVGVPTGWTKGNIDVTCTPIDTVSGVASPIGTFNLSTNVPDGTETDAATSNSVTVCDVADNCSDAQLSGLMIDNKAPDVSCAATDDAWHGSDVVLNCTSTDSGSGLANDSDAQFTLSTNVASGSETDTAGTDSRQVCDAVNNCVTVGPFGPVKVDKKGPDLSGAPTSAANENGWYDQSVTIHWTCSDAGSGVNACPDDKQITTEGTGLTASANAVDNVGNQTTADSSPGVNIDLTAPTVSYTGNQGTYSVDQTVNIACNANDALSGIDTSNCQDINGPAWSFALGSNEYRASAIDKAGNVGNGNVSFTVSVTPDSLCALTKQMVRNKTSGTLLCQPLIGAKFAESMHIPFVKHMYVQVYVIKVKMEWSLTPSQKSTLIRLARGL